MPITPTYPGVYVEEIPSGVRSIAGVATSITAFIGRARRGPVNDPITINNWGDYERLFGGLWLDSPVSFAVKHFYENGGGQAIIVRLYRPFFATEAIREATRAAAEAVRDAVAGADTKDEMVPDGEAALEDYPSDPEKSAAELVLAAARAAYDDGQTIAEIEAAANAAVGEAAPLTKARLTVDTLNLEAANEGAWGNKLRARVDHNVDPDRASSDFNLTVFDDDSGVTETIRGMSVGSDDPRRVDRVLDQQSRLVRVMGPLPGARPAETAVTDDSKDLSHPANTVNVADADKATDGEALETGDYTGSRAKKTGLYALEKTDLFNLLCIPPYSFSADVHKSLWSTAAVYCEERRAFLLVDAPSSWTSKDAAKSGLDGDIGLSHRNAAIFFPRLRKGNPLRDYQLDDFAPCGAVAGLFARTDVARGVWKAPAGLDAILRGVPQLTVSLTDDENGELNPLGINCLRSKPPAGRLVWGSRTLKGDDRLASEWKYVPVRRVALMIEESLFRGTQWVVFEPNDERLWAQIRLNINAFMHRLFRLGAFAGLAPADAYFVKCDAETTTPTDVNLGIVNISVGFAPLKPAEFVILKIQQIAREAAA